MADRVSHRRALANSFFLGLNTALLALTSTIAGLSSGQVSNEIAGLGIAIFGLPLAYIWFRTLKSYRQLNTGKFQVVHDLETKLPAAPYADEWVKLGEGKNDKLYTPLTEVEAWVPKLFAAGYLAAMLFAIGLLLTE